jgi:hypothetical protein
VNRDVGAVHFLRAFLPGAHAPAADRFSTVRDNSADDGRFFLCLFPGYSSELDGDAGEILLRGDFA